MNEDYPPIQSDATTIHEDTQLEPSDSFKAKDPQSYRVITDDLGDRTVTVALGNPLVVLAEAEAKDRGFELSHIIEIALWNRYGDRAAFASFVAKHGI